MEKIVNLAKQYGFVYQGSEIYNGLANTWDYGPLGVEMKKNIKDSWWDTFVSTNKLNVGIDSSIFMNSLVWQASGHIGGFSDPLIDCKECKSRHRADNLIENFTSNSADKMSNDEMLNFINENKIVCPNCGELNYTEIRNFDLMFKTEMGVISDEGSQIYLRPETAQGIFVNFKNISRTSRKKIPFGVGQIGKSFRNEITPGNFIYRTREFEQMELEFFVKPGEELKWFDYWQEEIETYITNIGLKKENYKIVEHSEDQLAHYSNKTIDIEYKFPFGWGELWGLSSRTDYDLKAHEAISKQDLHYNDLITNEKYLPYVIEPSVGVDRLFLALLVDSYEEEELEDGDVREVLHLNPKIAPIKIAVLPLMKKLSDYSQEVFDLLNTKFSVEFDESGKIGKRYRRQDVIGTPWCVTYDYDSIENNDVTVRDRDTMEQERVKIDELVEYFNKKLED